VESGEGGDGGDGGDGGYGSMAFNGVQWRSMAVNGMDGAEEYFLMHPTTSDL